MTAVSELRLVEGAAEPQPAKPAPTVFARTISVPAGLPWDQDRIARLDARAGAPLPLAEVVWRLRRLSPWSPGRPARYSACYVRALDVGDHLIATVTIDGQPTTVEFVSLAERARRARRSGTVALAAGVTVALVIAAFVSALAARSTAEARLRSVERASSLRLRQAKALERLDHQTRALNGAHVQHQAIGDLLGDLGWAESARSSDAHVDAFHWDRGYIGVEVRGETPPFSETARSVVKAPRPLRPGVWLWGVGPPTPASSVPAVSHPPATSEGADR